MAFSRALQPAAIPEADALSSAMIGIGMQFAGGAAMDPNIEDTLLFASIQAMECDDLRVLAVLVTWFGVHSPWVNADRLTKLVTAQKPPVLALWTALGQWQSRDRRYARLSKAYQGHRINLLATGTPFQIKRHGEDPRFQSTVLRVPANVLRDRSVDVLSPPELARRHRPYRFRVLIGPTYRADMWAMLDANPTLTPTALARGTYGSFSSAWHVKRDYTIVARLPAGLDPHRNLLAPRVPTENQRRRGHNSHR